MEEWKIIKGYPDYQISSFGRVKRIDTGYILNPWEQSWGYLQVTLNGDHKRVHLLVLETFTGKRPDGYEGNHKDGNKKNNYLKNLEWVTPSENMMHSYETGLHPKMTGENHPMSKLTESDVDGIKERLKNKKWGMVSAIAREYGVNKSTISSIGLGKSWI